MRLIRLGAERLQRAAVVADRHAGDLADQPVGDARGNLARDQLVLAVVAPADDEVEAGVDLLQQQRDVGRIVLQVAVHGDEHFAVRVLDARRHRRRLAVVAAELDDAQPRIAACERRSDRDRVVLAAVVDEHHLERPAELIERLHDRLVQRANAFLLVVQRHDDGKRGTTRGLVARCAASMLPSGVVLFAPDMTRSDVLTTAFAPTAPLHA